MNAEEAKMVIKSLKETAENCKESTKIVAAASNQAANSKKLFREGNESKLIKLGIAVIAFPEPTPISEIVGGSMVVAGAVNKGIKSRAAFAEDIGKDFKKALRDLSLAKDLL